MIDSHGWQVASHGYGARFDPPKGQRKEVEPEAVWAPVTPSRGFPELARVPKSALNDQVLNP